jgi:hypothetical protein
MLIYELDVQSNRLSRLNSRAIVPIFELPRGTSPVQDFHTSFEIDGAMSIMPTEEISAIIAGYLKRHI